MGELKRFKVVRVSRERHYVMAKDEQDAYNQAYELDRFDALDDCDTSVYPMDN